VGFAVGGYGINVSHELTHRVWHKFSWIWGRWILSLSLSTDFSQEHVYGHHLTVATPQDPATARRGETVYAFVPRSIWGSLVNAWRWEAARLSKKGYAVWGLRNQVLRGWGMSLAIGAFFYYAAGPLGLALFVAQAMWARTLLEVVNYMEHYGLVRVPAQRVQPRHSWNTNKLVSSLILFSLTRHSAHHEKGSVPFWRLNPYPEAPEMPFGYLTTIYVALLPPLWFAIMKPKLAHWDQNYATAEELELLQGN
jgi:alkane 1-monooxygenase